MAGSFATVNREGIKVLTLGGKITGLRRSAGLTQRELAKRTGVAQSTISAVELDQRVPDLDTLKSLGVAFGVSAAEILTGVVDLSDVM